MSKQLQPIKPLKSPTNDTLAELTSEELRRIGELAIEH